MLKKIASYFVPIRILKFESERSGPMEIALENGKKVLNSANSNYSYGSLQRVLRTGLVAMNFDERFQRILVLGMGAGSIVETIRKHFRSNAFIELIEFDAEIIRIANAEFGMGVYENIHISYIDAETFLRTTPQKFDLIIVDLFLGSTIPEKFLGTAFCKEIAQKTNQGGSILFNTMLDTLTENQLKQLQSKFENAGFLTRILWRIENYNNLLIAEKS
jgi:spermidine synthase